MWKLAMRKVLIKCCWGQKKRKMEAGDDWATGNQGSADPTLWGKQNFGHKKHGQKHMTAVCVCVCDQGKWLPKCLQWNNIGKLQGLREVTAKLCRSNEMPSSSWRGEVMAWQLDRGWWWRWVKFCRRQTKNLLTQSGYKTFVCSHKICQKSNKWITLFPWCGNKSDC